jgi:hypothetical protein
MPKLKTYNNVTAIVKTFLRDDCLYRCVKSLIDSYPGIRIAVADDGRMTDDKRDFYDMLESFGHKVMLLPFDCGLPVGRNRLMESVGTKYILVGDDDFYYDAKCDIGKLVGLLDAEPGLDVACGAVMESGNVRHYEGTLEFSGRNLHIKRLTTTTPNLTGKTDWFPVDIGFNFFVACTERIMAVPWEETIKVAYEHSSWFIDLKLAGRKVAYVPDVRVIHKHPDMEAPSDEYRMARMRRTDRDAFFAKYGWLTVTDMRGFVDRLAGSEASSGGFSKLNQGIRHVDFCVTTFYRRKALKRLLKSIAKYYPSANVYVADQTFSRTWWNAAKKELRADGLHKRVIVRNMPFDCGVSLCRNKLMASTPNKYKLLLEDDFEFTGRTAIAEMVDFLDANKNCYAVGGSVVTQGTDNMIDFTFYPRKEGDEIVCHPDGDKYVKKNGLTVKRTGCVPNFTLFCRELFHHVAWDNRLKNCEHIDFYLRFPKGAEIWYMPAVQIDHVEYVDSEYRPYRRRDEFLAVMLKKYNVRRLVYSSGSVAELDGEAIKRYKLNKVKL